MGYKVYSLTNSQVNGINSELMKFDDNLMQMYMLVEGKTYKFLNYSKAYILAPTSRGGNEEWHIVYYSGSMPNEVVSVNNTNGTASVSMWAGAYYLTLYDKEVKNGHPVSIPKSDYNRAISLIRQAADRRKRDTSGLI